VIATALRVPQGLPVRPVWFALFGGLLALSLLRRRRERGTPPAPPTAPPAFALRLHRWSALVLVAFAALHMLSHLSAAHSLALNTRVVDAFRLAYKQPPLEALLLLAVPIQIVTGLLLVRAAKNRPPDGWDRLQRASGVYLAAFLGAHTIATAWLFRDLNFRAASGGRPGVFGDPSFLAYYALGPLAVFVHVAAAVRSLLLARLGPARSERLARGLLGAGCAATLVIALALCGVHYRNDRDKPQPRPARVGWR
jgi:succinate dehydrogenase/fumarate reductase cytochrome b subunit